MQRGRNPMNVYEMRTYTLHAYGLDDMPVLFFNGYIGICSGRIVWQCCDPRFLGP
jgi:hypothetical protein